MPLFEMLGYYLRLIRCSLFQRPQRFIISDLKGGEGRFAIVTGGNAGIGVETVRLLCKAGFTVILASRNIERGELVRKELEDEEGHSLLIKVMQLDLADLHSVAKFVSNVAAELKGKKLSILVHNGGVYEIPYGKSKQGHELQFATNHLGPFLLSKLLLPHLDSPGGRIVYVNAELHTLAKDASPDFKYSDAGTQAYCRSKLAQIWGAYELQRRRPDLIVPVLHPGVVKTRMTDNVPSLIRRWLFLTAAEGAQTTIYCCLHPDVQGLRYYHNSLGLLPSSRVSYDKEKAAAMVALSEKLVTGFL